MDKVHYLSPSFKEIRLDASGVIAASPLENEEIISSGGILEWEW